jgi:hypothetical protein
LQYILLKYSKRIAKRENEREGPKEREACERKEKLKKHMK